MTQPTAPTATDQTAASCNDLCAFLDAAPSAYHVAAEVGQRLTATGFVSVEESERWNALPAAGFVRQHGALIAWRLPANLAPATPFRIVGAHTDSPGFRLKPTAGSAAYGWEQINVEVYGGILNNSWLDRDLGVAGCITHHDGSTSLIATDRPIARIPQLAVHLDRDANNGLTLDPQQHLKPVWALSHNQPNALIDWLCEHAGCDDAATWDLALYDTQPAAILGADMSLLASGRLDNQVSCWAGTHALIAARPSDHIAVLVLNDHEEVGSASTTGAAGAWLERVLERIAATSGGDRSDFLRALTQSMCVSADNAHAVHPNYPNRHDPDHLPMVNRGPAIKINHNQRYATTPATAQSFADACTRADIAVQQFVSRNNMPCGSTIGPITSTRLGIATVDVGVPQLSMHSARELCGTRDPGDLATALRTWLTSS